jgi:uncharacterized membrane protein
VELRDSGYGERDHAANGVIVDLSGLGYCGHDLPVIISCYCYDWGTYRDQKPYDLCLNTEIKSDRIHVPNLARNLNFSLPVSSHTILLHLHAYLWPIEQCSTS